MIASPRLISVVVNINPLDNAFAFAPFAPPFHVPSYADAPTNRFALSGAQLEQQHQRDRSKAQVQQQRQQQYSGG